MKNKSGAIKRKTWGETANEFLDCKTKEEAQSWFAKEVKEHSKAWGRPIHESDQIIRSSLGYMMGYYDDATARRMQKLLNLTHPVMPWVGK